MADAAATTKTVKKASKPKKPASHPKYSDMIQTAIGALKERSGSSKAAIAKYIDANYKIAPTATTNSHLKHALRAGVASGQLKQTKGTGASGSFKILAKTKPAAKKAKKPKTVKPKKTKTPKKAAKKPAAKKAAKKPAAKKSVKAKKPKTPKKAAAKPKKAAKSPKKAKKPAAKKAKPAKK